MRAEYLTSVAAVAMLGIGAASAADLPVKALPPAAPVFSWTGFYVGANIGAARADNSSQEIGPNYWFDPPPAPVYGASSTGVTGGIQAGYNWQFQRLVLGVEGDVNLASADATTTRVASFDKIVQTASLTGLATLRGRAGFALDNALIYLTAGVATGRVHDRVVDALAPNIIFDTSGWRTGWTAGGGVEFAVAKNWTVKAEALYVDFGNTSAPMLVDNTYRFRFKDTATVARAGFNFRF
jgi:outer membrane immunogenic protein